MKSHSKAQPSQRQLRVGEQLRHIVADTLLRGHFHHESLIDASKITVTEVRISPDLKNATAYVIAMADENIEDFLPALNEDSSVFQKEINRQSNLKFTPRVQFKTDTSFENSQRIEKLLHEINHAEDSKES
ncbi:MAG: ribosome-binding factor A [Micavibrio sp.]|nr:MAG: ribosome-binding factor A [Micavibrio sp.]